MEHGSLHDGRNDGSDEPQGLRSDQFQGSCSHHGDYARMEHGSPKAVHCGKGCPLDALHVDCIQADRTQHIERSRMDVAHLEGSPFDRLARHVEHIRAERGRRCDNGLAEHSDALYISSVASALLHVGKLDTPGQLREHLQGRRRDRSQCGLQNRHRSRLPEGQEVP